MSLIIFPTVAVFALFLRWRRKLLTPIRCLVVIPLYHQYWIGLYLVDSSLVYMCLRYRTYRWYLSGPYLAFSLAVSITSSINSSFSTTYIFLRYPSYNIWGCPRLKTIVAFLCTFLLVDSLWNIDAENFSVFWFPFFFPRISNFVGMHTFPNVSPIKIKYKGIRAADFFSPVIRLVMHHHRMTIVIVLLLVTNLAVQLPVTFFGYL